MHACPFVLMYVCMCKYTCVQARAQRVCAVVSNADGFHLDTYINH